jgi:lysophospholipid acyltransferase (LPLAT)-like uncharacterized protein
VERAWVLNSWDRMILPMPFSRACAYGSNPITVPAGATDEQLETLHQEMQAALERCKREAEKALGLSEMAGD